jgi:hypothetical protein
LSVLDKISLFIFGPKINGLGCTLYVGKCAEKTISSTKKKKPFFHTRISRSGKGRVSDFSATRVRVEGVGSPEWDSRSGKKYFLFGEDGIFFAKLAFSTVTCGI